MRRIEKTTGLLKLNKESGVICLKDTEEESEEDFENCSNNKINIFIGKPG